MTVRKNVEFGLKNRKLPKEKIAEQTDKFMKLMHVDEYADRRQSGCPAASSSVWRWPRPVHRAGCAAV